MARAGWDLPDSGAVAGGSWHGAQALLPLPASLVVVVCPTLSWMPSQSGPWCFRDGGLVSCDHEGLFHLVVGRFVDLGNCCFSGPVKTVTGRW